MSVQNLDKLCLKLDGLSDVELLGAAQIAAKTMQKAAQLGCQKNHGELQDSILKDAYMEQSKAIGICYTDKAYARYVEFGTGPRGQADHAGISPNVTPAYTQRAWWIHESQIEPGTAERYGWFYIDTDDGRFYQCNGQEAHPFMYPALHDSKEAIIEEISAYAAKVIARTIR